MTTARFIVGDSLTVLRSLPDASVDLVLTSPPFLALRSYLPADHPDKASEVGAEATPGEFIDTLLDIIEECRRVLTPHGSICFELGDSYSGSGGSGGDYLEGGLREGQAHFSGTAATARSANGRTVSLDADRYAGSDSRPGWPLAKSLCLVPELLRLALAYGVNPLTERKTEPWRVRNVVRWCRPNPPVGALADKFRPATSDMLVACVDRQRFFDLEAVREPASDPRDYKVVGAKAASSHESPRERGGTRSATTTAPPLDWWKISTEPYKGSHYAVWPTALLVKPIKAMCPERVCMTCGEPSRRITERTPEYAADREAIGDFNQRDRARGEGVSGSRSVLSKAAGKDMTSAENITVGWTDCGHNTWRPGVVLDPFAGSGTTLAVATGHGRDAIGIDLDERNVELARERIGFFLVVESEPGVGQAAPDSDSAHSCTAATDSRHAVDVIPNWPEGSTT